MRSAHTSLAAVLAAASFTLACSGDSSGPGAQFAGGWTGTTSQNRPSHFLIVDGKVVIAAISFAVVGSQCTDDVFLVIGRDPSEAGFALNGSSLSVNTSGSAGSVAFTGTLDGTSASGTLTINSIGCQGNANLTWTAQKAAGPQVNLGGIWDGTFQSSLTQTSGSLVLSQSGANVTGTYSTDAGGAGTVTAAVTGTMATFGLNQTTPGCTGSYTGYATLIVPIPTVEELVYFYSGQDCLGSHTDGFGIGQRAALGALREEPAAGPRSRLVFDR